MLYHDASEGQYNGWLVGAISFLDSMSLLFHLWLHVIVKFSFLEPIEVCFAVHE